MSAEVGMSEESSEQEGVSGRFALGFVDGISMHGEQCKWTAEKAFVFCAPVPSLVFL